MSDARAQFKQAAEDLEATLRGAVDDLTALHLAKRNYSAARLALSIEQRQAQAQGSDFELHCRECDGVAGTWSSAEIASQLDQEDWRCGDCGAQGVIDVDGDEDGCHVAFIPARSEP